MLICPHYSHEGRFARCAIIGKQTGIAPYDVSKPGSVCGRCRSEWVGGNPPAKDDQKTYTPTVLSIISGVPVQEVRHEPAPTRPRPTVLQMSFNLTKAVAGWVRSGLKIASQEKFDARLEICRGCDLWDEKARMGLGFCKHPHCGCTKAKHWLESSVCPDKKW